MIPDPENGETSSKSNPARRFLSPFTEDRIRSGQVWLAPIFHYLCRRSNTPRKTASKHPFSSGFHYLCRRQEAVRKSWRINSPDFAGLSLSLPLKRKQFKPMEYNFKEIEAKGSAAGRKRKPIAWKPIPHVPNSTCSTCSPTLRVRVCTSDTRWAISLRTSTRATNGFAASTYFIRWATTLSACLPNSTPFRRGSTPP